MNIFMDNEDMEERYAEGLYKDYLEEQNKQLQQENQRLKEEKDKIDKMYLNAYKYSQKMEDKYILTKSIINELRESITSKESLETFRTIESREEWLKVHHNLLEILDKVGDAK